MAGGAFFGFGTPRRAPRSRWRSPPTCFQSHTWAPLLLVNAHEASLFLGGSAVPDADADTTAQVPVRDTFASHGLDRVVVTLGAAGSVVLDSDADGLPGRGGCGAVTRLAATEIHSRFTGNAPPKIQPKDRQ